MLTSLGVNLGANCFGGPEAGKQGRKFRRKISPSKFAEKLAGNFPKIRRAKIKDSPQIRTAKPRAQEITAF